MIIYVTFEEGTHFLQYTKPDDINIRKLIEENKDKVFTKYNPEKRRASKVIPHILPDKTIHSIVFQEEDKWIRWDCHNQRYTQRKNPLP